MAKLNWSSLHRYTSENVSRYVPRVAGVYRLAYKKGERLPVFYVGRADVSLEDRLNDHLDASEPNACVRKRVKGETCYFRYARVADERTRKGAERALYDHYKPECNEQPPEGPAIDINFE